MIPFRSIFLAAAVLSSLAAPAWPAWVPLGPDGGTVLSLAVDPSRPSVLYAGTPAAGVFKSTDAGLTWAWSGAGLDAERLGREIFTLAVDTRHPATVLAGVQDGLFRSRDAGATWAPASPDLHEGVFALLFDPQRDRVLYAGTVSGVFRSRDGGATWQRRGPRKQVAALAIDPARGFLYAGYQDNTVLRSVNAGASWVGGRGLPPGGHLAALTVDPLHPGVVLAGTGSGAYRSLDGGGTWRRAQGIPGPAVAFAVQPSRRQIYAAVAGSHGVFFSTDGGAHWKVCPGQPADPAVLALAASAAAVYAGTEGVNHPPGGVFRSADGGASWSLRSRGLSTLEIADLAFDPLDPDTLYAAARGLGLFRSADGGAHWEPLDLGVVADVIDLFLEPDRPSTVYAVSQSRPSLLRSADGGATWESLQTPVLTRLADDPRAPGALWAAGPLGLYHSGDSGETWTQAPLPPVSPPYARLSMVNVWTDPGAPQIVWTSGALVSGITSTYYSPRVFRSVDGGQTWEQRDGDLHFFGTADVTPDAADPDVLYIPFDEGLFRTTDGGLRWSFLPSLGDKTVRAVASTPTALWAGVWPEGPYRSTDNGATWTLVRAGLTARYVLWLQPDPRDPGRLFAGTRSGGLFVLER